MPVTFSLYPAEPSEQLAASWQRLAATTKAPFMMSWSWMGPWLSTIDHPCWVIEGRLDEKVVCLSILGKTVDRRAKGLISSRQISLNRAGVAQLDQVTQEYNGLLVDPDVEKDALKGFVEFLKHTDALGDWDEFIIHNAAVGWHEKLVSAELVCTPVWQQAAYEVNLAGLRQKGQSFLESLSRNTRAQIRRSLRDYEALNGPVIQRQAGSAEEAVEWLIQAGPLHRARWPGSGFENPHFVRFHTALIEANFDAGMIDFVRIEAGGRLIGFLYNFIDGDTVLFYLSALVYEDGKALKPGLTAQALLHPAPS